MPTPFEGHEASPQIHSQVNPPLDSLDPISPSASKVAPICSYASLIDPNEGTSPEFVQSAEINGSKCAQICHEDVIDEIAY